MLDFLAVLEKETGKKGIAYNGDVDDEQVATLYRVNDEWKNYDFILTNNKITVGVNYDLEDEEHKFDHVFVSVAGFNAPRDIIQVSCRCRHIKNPDIKLCFIDQINTNDKFRNDDFLVGNCEIYQKLRANILVERQAPLQDALLFFCRKAGYAVVKDDRDLDDELDKEIKKMFQPSEFAYCFKKIPDIKTYQQMEDLQQKLYSFTATLEDKLMIQKAFFVKKFKPGVTQEQLATAWDNRYDMFFDRLTILMKSTDTVFHDIMKLNRWGSIIPDTDEALDNVKVNDQIKKRILQEFHFPDIHMKTTDKIFVRNAFNTFFSKQVVKPKRNAETNNHYNYFIPEIVREMFVFGLNHIQTKEKKQYVKVTGLDYGMDQFLDED
jgi:hypothetical protein